MVLSWSVSRYSISYPVEFSLHCISHVVNFSSILIIYKKHANQANLRKNSFRTHWAAITDRPEGNPV